MAAGKIYLPKTKRTYTKKTMKRVKRGYQLSQLPTSKGGIYHFRRYASSVSAFTLTGNAAWLPYQGQISYQLSHLAQVSDFSNLFDQYRINKVVTKFWLRIDPGAQAAATASYPKIFYVYDNDDTGLLSQNEMRERAGMRIRVLHPNRPVTCVSKPAVLSEVYRSAVATTYSPKWKQWIDMSTTDVPHYGLKFNIDDLTNTNYKVDVETIIYFSCRHTR